MSFTAHALAHRAGAGLTRCTAGSSSSTRLPAVFLAATSTASTPATRPFLRPATVPRRGFAHSLVRPKKASGASKKDKKDKASSSSSSSSSSQSRETADEEDGAGHPQANVEAPFDFADVESRWQRSNAHHEDKFKELRRVLGSGAADGSAIVDVDAIGATPVSVGADPHQPPHKGQHKGAAAAAGAGAGAGAATAAAATTTTTTLAELALVIPRAGGRFVELRMHSAASRKAITRAVQASPLFRGQQPQPDPDDELVLLLRTGSPHEGAAGSSEAAAVAAERVRRVSDLANAWRAQIRRATARRQKTHQAWKKDGSVRPDDLHRLDRDLLRGQDKHLARIDAAEKDALRQLEHKGRR